jgi:hypothetical protein
MTEIGSFQKYLGVELAAISDNGMCEGLAVAIIWESNIWESNGLHFFDSSAMRKPFYFSTSATRRGAHRLPLSKSRLRNLVISLLASDLKPISVSTDTDLP